MPLLASPAPFLLVLLLFLLPLPPCQPESQRGDPSGAPYLPSVSPSMFPSSFAPSTTSSSRNVTGKCDNVPVCQPGILLPVWKPLRPGLGDQVARAVVYFVSLMYMFLGVSIIADRFMASIEVITSQVRTRDTPKIEDNRKDYKLIKKLRNPDALVLEVWTQTQQKIKFWSLQTEPEVKDTTTRMTFYISGRRYFTL